MKRNEIKVLVGCESSGVVRRAFDALGFDVWSCDLLPAEDKSQKHLRCDVREALKGHWDLAIMHPPCTRLCNSGVRWLHKPPAGKSIEKIWQELQEGADLFSACWGADVSHVAVENPVMHKYAKARIRNFEPAAQTVQPWWFGDPAFKATGLYLRGLPPLTATNRLVPPVKDTEDHRRWSAVHRAPPSAERWRSRSRTYEGVAAAMAEQWGRHIIGAREDRAA